MSLLTLPPSTGSSPAAMRIREAERRAIERTQPEPTEEDRTEALLSTIRDRLPWILEAVAERDKLREVNEDLRRKVEALERLRDPVGRFPAVDSIITQVCVHYDISRRDLVSQRRTDRIVQPRQLAIYLVHILTARTLSEIGRHFGGRDHTTVLHAIRKMKAAVAADPALREEVEMLSAKVAGRSK